jgi:hypothetical protein
MRVPTVIPAAIAATILSTASHGHQPPRTDGEPTPSLCDLVEQALLATMPKPSPAVEFSEREERRAAIERVRRQVQRLRDEGRCP